MATLWEYDKNPTQEGWYPVLLCWDPNEGHFPAAAYWDGERWTSGPVAAFVPMAPCADLKEARDWAYKYDPEF